MLFKNTVTSVTLVTSPLQENVSNGYREKNTVTLGNSENVERDLENSGKGIVFAENDEIEAIE
jgi:hypothetical protein